MATTMELTHIFHLNVYTDLDIASPVPMAVQARMFLNSQGMKFKDDGMPSAIVNEQPEPLGYCKWWDELGTDERVYIQVLKEEADGSSR